MKRLALALMLVSPAAGAQTLGVGPETGLPLPRFESLRFNEVNLRRGAGETYPIAWTFVRRGLPMEVFQEFEDWRHVRDHDGATGWIKRTQLSPARFALVRDERIALHEDPDTATRIVAEADPGAVLALETCGPDWCRAKAKGYRGWIEKRPELWGVLAEETFGD